MKDYHDGEPGNSIRDRETEFVSEYAQECRKIGAKYLVTRAKRRVNQGLTPKGGIR